MKVTEQGIFSDINFWKLGCHWGSRKPSFYNTLKSENIVIGHEANGIYDIGDIVLIAEGYTILALAQIKSNPIAILSNKKLVEKLENDEVEEFEYISYYEVEFYEFPDKDRFKYELQQGIVKVHKNDIKKSATQRWLKRNSPSEEDKRIMRLTWNTNNWNIPSGHPWRKKNQNKKYIAYENQYGYGHEEWLFNKRFRIDGFQYGYIRGVNNISTEIKSISQIALYTIRNDKQRCLVGNLFNVKMIEGLEAEQQTIADLISAHKVSMKKELERVGADFEHFEKDQLLPNVKFKWSDADIFLEPKPVDFLNGAEFNRYQAYYLSDELKENIQKEFEEEAKFNFQPGKASNTGEYTKSSTENETQVRRRHGKITDDLYDYLLAIGNCEENVSVEKTRVGGAIVDVVLRTNNSYDLFEIKTSKTALKNIRQALGQIFEYALLDKDVKCKSLVIVGPAKLKLLEREYFSRLKALINIKLEYWEYNSNEELIENKFIKE